jgi:hypothetical protein
MRCIITATMEKRRRRSSRCSARGEPWLGFARVTCGGKNQRRQRATKREAAEVIEIEEEESRDKPCARATWEQEVIQRVNRRPISRSRGSRSRN